MAQFDSALKLANKYKQDVLGYKEKVKLLDTELKKGKEELIKSVYLIVKQEMEEMKQKGIPKPNFIVSDERDTIDHLLYDIKANLKAKGFDLDSLGLKSPEIFQILSKALMNSGILEMI